MNKSVKKLLWLLALLPLCAACAQQVLPPAPAGQVVPSRAH